MNRAPCPRGPRTGLLCLTRRLRGAQKLDEPRPLAQRGRGPGLFRGAIPARAPAFLSLL